MSENKFTDTLNQLLDQLETVKTEIEKQNARVKELEASNAELLELVCDIDEELSLAQADAIETGNMTGSSLPANLIIRLRQIVDELKADG